MAPRDPRIEDHLQWLGFVRPVGLVVSAPALVRAGAIVGHEERDGQRRLRACVSEPAGADGASTAATIEDFSRFAREVLGWSFSPRGYAGGEAAAIPEGLIVAIPEAGVTLRPDFAVREIEPRDDECDWQLLVRVLDGGIPFDEIPSHDALDATEHGRMERLLRDTGVSAGLLCNGVTLRLISAPRGESSGWLDFTVADMVQTAGRPICAAMIMLLSQQRLLSLPREQRLAGLLRQSRAFQNEVSERLSGQVLGGLYALLRGFQAADDASHRTLLAQTLAEEPDTIYRGLLTVILRLVFLLYAEERDMLPHEETFTRGYSLAALHARLREDAGRHPDAMEQRYGAWAQLLALFRMVYDGARTGEATMPPRHGVLFDPDRYPFLEGRAITARQVGERIEPPRVSDGTVLEVLERLLVLDGDRLSYRALDVEQIGSVYETMMGFRLRQTTGRSVAIRAAKTAGAPTVIDLDELLTVPGGKRAKWVLDTADRKLTPKVAAAVAAAEDIGAVHAALSGVIDTTATPDLVSPGAMALQPSAERRRSGSHYTPRALTEPIVRTALAPVLERLRDGHLAARADDLLELRVCDPAMGSAAFLVEACRQLGDELVASWDVYGGRPEIPPDEDAVTYARRLIAQRCLYGVDRNPVAVDLAKMSLWLVTLASDHPLTFLDHALRHGDSLVGLDRRQIETFDWKAGAPSFAAIRIGSAVERVAQLRAAIREAGDDVSDAALRDLWDEAEHELSDVRLCGDLLLEAFFSGEKAKDRETARVAYADEIVNGTAGARRAWLEELRHAERPLAPFHWEVELPEVFNRENPGFDVIVGNPPFAGKNTLADGNLPRFADWLKASHPESHGNADLVAHFFRRGFDLLRNGGTLGLIGTNTIGQGDTRSTGLRWICEHGGEIYAARKRVKWPGRSAIVVVSLVHIAKGVWDGAPELDGTSVERITAYLFHAGGNQDPARLRANAGKSFQGPIALGMGFTFDDADPKGIATPTAELKRLIRENPANAEVVFSYIGGQEVNTSPVHASSRYVINFGERPLEECRKRWPSLVDLVEAKVKPERDRLSGNPDAERRRRLWWQFGRLTRSLDAAISCLPRMLVHPFVSSNLGFAFVQSDTIVAGPTNVFPLNTLSAFAALQSRCHEVWTRFFGSSLGDGLRYTPSDCFETFPFPLDWTTDPSLEAAGQTYYDFRAQLMVDHDEGLTKTYNRFHDPNETDPSILRLRELHTEMDRAVLHAYGWDDVPTDCEFLLDYEIDEAEWGTKKKPYRYRWPDAVRDDVLARLIALNGERADEEQRSGAAAAPKKPRPTKPKQREALL
jgi:hypothetical protein